MKNFLLIILMVILPMQAFASADRSFTHVLSGAGQLPESVARHVSAHADRVLHHHDNHSSDNAVEIATHVDNSEESYSHIADFDLSCGMNFLLPAVRVSSLPAIDRIVPTVRPDAFSNRTTSPLLRPPRAFA